MRKLITLNYFRIHCPTVLLIFVVITITACDKVTSITSFYEQASDKPFDDIVQDVEFIVTEYNFRITARLHIGDAIQDRGTSSFPRNEVILFCNLTLAEKMLLIDPTYVNYCPYKIAVGEVNDKNIISTRLLPENTGKSKLDDIAKKTNKIIKAMIEYAASDDPFSAQALKNNEINYDE